MPAATVVLLALTIGAVTPHLGQARPDFSGRWTTDPAPAATQPAGGSGGGAPGAATQGRGRGARGDMGSGWGPTISITQDPKLLVVEYSFFARGDLQPPMRFVYALDGSETRHTLMMGRGTQIQTSRAVWDGATLKITTTHRLTDPDTGKPATADVVQVLSLDAEGQLVVEVTRAGAVGGAATTTRTVYRRT